MDKSEFNIVDAPPVDQLSDRELDELYVPYMTSNKPCSPHQGRIVINPLYFVDQIVV